MEAYIAFGVFVIIVIVLMLGKGIWDDRMMKRNFIRKLHEEYGKPPAKEYNEQQYHSISHFYNRHITPYSIDDITWNDLSYDDIFKRLNDTYSSAGEEVLYNTLRNPKQSIEELKHFDELVEYFGTHSDERIKLQVILAQLGKTGKFSLYDYLDYLDVLGEKSNLKHYILNILLVPAIATCFFEAPIGLVLVVGIMIVNMISYFKEKNEVDPYITSFAYIMRLLKAADAIERLKIDACSTEQEKIRTHKKGLIQFRRGSFWLMSSGRMSGSGNPIDIILDYLRMVLHLDLIKFNNMLMQVRKHVSDIDELVQVVGYLETTIAIGAYRKSVENQWCKPVLSEKEILCAVNVYHPLITEPVKNSISASKGVLLTGSNASGKSTFLKTIAVTAIMAQTIYTCPADAYEGSFYKICSSMALRDNLQNKESYFVVEIKSLKRIVDAVAESKYKILCFVDEVLRGTNTIERIAASTQILNSLIGKNVQCFAATHDLELSDLLAKDYDNYHFKETVENGDVCFNYKLLDGKATTRNAIKLLSVMGYDDSIIEKANEQAESFLKTGVWRA